MDPVPLADKDQSDALGYKRAAVFLNGNIVLKVGDAPGFRLCGSRENAEEQREERNHL
jgi:hypothetical protein